MRLVPCSLLRPLTVVAVGFLSACPLQPPVEGEGEGEGEEGEGEGELPGDGNCPEVALGTHSVCDLQDAASENHPANGAQATLDHVFATSDTYVMDRDDTTDEPRRFGVFVSDHPADKRSGVLVTWTPELVVAEITIGQGLRIVGQSSEFQLNSGGAPNTETRLTATSVEILSDRTQVDPVVLADASVLANEATGEDYEGVLVTINNVSVTEIGQFGQFTLTGGIITDDTLFRYAATQGETFTSITGVVAYNIFTGGGFRLLPRQASDVVSSNRPSNTVTDLHDGTIRRCAFDEFNQCVAVVTGVVTSPTIFVSRDDTRGPKFGFWVGDPENIDGDGRFGPQSGIFVTVSPDNPGEPVGLDGYTFDQDEDLNFSPGAAPEVGDLIEVVGDNSASFDQSELRFVSSLRKVSAGTTVPLPALFDGSLDASDPRHPSALKGGRPDFAAADFTTGFDPPLEGVAAAENLEQWEGVLVELVNVTTTTPCYAVPFSPSMGDAFGRDVGNFLVTGNAEIGDKFRVGFSGFFDSMTVPEADRTCANLANKCEDSRAAGQTFTSLKGIVDYGFSVWRVNPRSRDDVNATPGFVADGTGACPALTP